MAVSERKAGALLSYISLAINAIGSFLYVPILIGALGTSQYGVYQLIGSIIAYLSVMDMGLSTTLNRFYVRTGVLGRQKDRENLLSHAAIIYGVLTVLAVVAGFVFYALLEPLFGGSFTPGEFELARQMMVLVILNCIVVLPGNWFLAIINANERFIFARGLATIKYILQISSVIAVLQAWPSAMAVLIVQVFYNALVVVAYMLYVKGKLKVKAKFHYWDWHLIRSLFAFSGFILLNMVFDQIFWKTGQVVLGTVVNATAVGVYGVVCQLITNGYMGISTGVTSVFLPKLTAISARTDEMTEINELFNRIGRIQAILVWAVLAGFAVLGQEFVWLWAGPEYWEVYPSTLILMAGLCISLVQNLGLSVLQAKNKMGFRTVLYTVLAVLDVVVSIPVSAAFGVVGCAAVAAVLLFIGTGPIINVYYHKKIGINIPSFYKSILPLLVPVVIASVVTWTFSMCVVPEYSWINFILGVVVFLVIYVAALWVVGFNSYEKGLVSGIMQKVLRRGR